MAYAEALSEILQRNTEPVALAEPVTVENIPTPALLLDDSILERNLTAMANFLDSKGKGFRPHAKTHKCPIIAKKQMAAGAVGVCAAKLSEAAVLVNAGVTDVLITSAIVTPAKAQILVDLSARARLDIVVDSLAGLQVLSEALHADADLGVLIDLDINMGRTGTRSNDVMLDLAEKIASDPRMTFKGVQHYAGHLMHVAGYEDRRSKSLELWDKVAERVGLLDDRGFKCAVVTGCGTGTYNIDCDVDIVTDLQVGSYVFMDQEYRLVGGKDGELFDDFEVSLTVATTAISQPSSRAITVDGGYKVFASDTVNPEPLDLAGCTFRFGGDEHGILILKEGTQQPLLGSVQRFVTPHCDPTVNLHDAYWVHTDGLIHEKWPIAGRGCSW